MLLIHDCTYYPRETDDPEEASMFQMCGPARMIFDVEFDETEIAHAVFAVRFLRGSQECARASGIPYFVGPFTAGSRASFVVSGVSLVGQVWGGYIACSPLPVETTRLVVELIDTKTAMPLLRREFAYSYTFVER